MHLESSLDGRDHGRDMSVTPLQNVPEDFETMSVQRSCTLSCVTLEVLPVNKPILDKHPPLS